MSSKPRLSKRESSTALRQDTTSQPATSGKKRTSSIASNASRVSMFTNPTKHFGLTRKASTATLSAAPVSVSVGGLDHAVEAKPSSGSVAKGSGPDKVRPVRQATRAEDALRSVQSRAPQAPIPASEPELAPLSESPSSAPVPLPGITDALETPILSSSPTSTDNITPLSNTLPKSKITTPSKIPRLRASSSLLSLTNKDAITTSSTPAPVSSTPPVSSSPPAQPKFRTPPLTPSFGASRLARKSSTSSIRSNDPTNNKRSVSPSPLSLHSSTPPAPTPTLSAPSPTPVSMPVPGTGSSSSPNPSSTPAASSSWLTAIRSMGRSPAPSVAQPSAEDASSVPAESKSDMNGTALAMNKPSDDSAPSTPQLADTQTRQPDHNEHETRSKDLAAPVVSQDAVVILSPVPVSAVGPSSGTGTGDAQTLTINTLAAQHGARIGTGSGYSSPAGWIAWLTSTPSSNSTSPALVGAGRLQIGDGADDMVMYIDSEEEGEGTDAKVKDNGKGKAKDQMGRPGMGPTMLSVDSVVPVLSDGEGDNSCRHDTSRVARFPIMDPPNF
ncbi:hypothetical protein FRC07_003653 [Ceratobasidium sp. 392]|nr:hypothetical protein FRC07_003653 [Ceratobasidium sp. 392]